MRGGGSGGSDARAQEEERQARIRAGTANINQVFDSQFNDDFFRGRRTAYTDYATPQLQQQYTDAQKDLSFFLARTGMLDSSVRADKEAELSRLYGVRSREIGDRALDFERNARNSVEDARSSLVSQLAQTGNADQAAANATSRAAALSKPDSYSPVTDLFGDFLTTLGKQAAQERAEARSGGVYRANFNTGLFAPRSGAVRVSGS